MIWRSKPKTQLTTYYYNESTYILYVKPQRRFLLLLIGTVERNPSFEGKPKRTVFPSSGAFCASLVTHRHSPCATNRAHSRELC